MQQFALLGLAAVGDDRLQRLHPGAVGGVGAERADGPVAAEDDPVGAEAVEAMVDRGREVGGLPAGAGCGR